MLMDRPSVNPTPTPDSMVKAAAVAAGARIATAAAASSLIEAARSQNVVHITTGTTPVMKPSTSIGSQLPSNVHFIRNGLAKAPISTHSAPKPNIPPVEAKQLQNRPLKPAASPVPKLVGPAQVVKVTPEKENPTASASANGIKEVHQNNQASGSSENRSAALGNQSEDVGKSQPSSSNNAVKENNLEDQASISIPEPISQTIDDGVPLPCAKAEENGTYKIESYNQV